MKHNCRGTNNKTEKNYTFLCHPALGFGILQVLIIQKIKIALLFETKGYFLKYVGGIGEVLRRGSNEEGK